MRTGTISGRTAYNWSIKVGKNIVDKIEINNGKITLDEIKDLLEHSMRRKFRPIITDNEQEFLNCCKKFGVSEEQAQTIKNFARAMCLPKLNAKGYFIYVPKDTLNNPYVQLGVDIGHEVFHTLWRGKTAKGKKKLRELQKLLKKHFYITPGSDISAFTVKVQSLLFNALKIKDLANPTPEVYKLASRLRTENRCLAYIRTTLRTMLDPTLKEGEQRAISKSHSPIKRLINPNSIAVRPTDKDITGVQEILKEETMAYFVSSVLERYAYKLPPESTPISQVVSVHFKQACDVLNGEKEILAKNS